MKSFITLLLFLLISTYAIGQTVLEFDIPECALVNTTQDLSGTLLSSIQIYPNPASETLRLKWSSVENSTISAHWQMVNIIGQTVLSGELLPDKHFEQKDIIVGYFENGIYIFSLIHSEGVMNKKIMIKH